MTLDAYITSICHAEQLYTDTAFMLAASARGAAAAGSDARFRSDLWGELSRSVWFCSVPGAWTTFFGLDPEMVLNKPLFA